MRAVILRWLVPAFLLGVGVAFAVTLVVLYRERQVAVASTRWPKTTGQIAVAAVTSRQERVSQRTSTGTGSTWRTVTRYQPTVRYTYTVGGQTYTGSRIAFFSSGSGDEQDRAQATVARYPVGTSVMVAYDPSNPARSVLEPGLGGAAATLLLIGMAIGLALTIFFALVWIRTRGRGFSRPLVRAAGTS